MKTDFHCSGSLPTYVFANSYRLKTMLTAAGRDIIDLSMASPDYAPPEFVRDALAKYATRGDLYGYSASQGIKPLRDSFCQYMLRRFGVAIDSDEEMTVTIGSKEGLSSLATAISGPDDYIIVPDPCYPIHIFGFVIADMKVAPIAAMTPDNFIQKIEEEILARGGKKPLAIIVNYPSNPTADICDLAFYQELVDFAIKQQIYIISDLAYAEIYFGETAPPSILQVPNARDVAIEFHTMSKSYSMAGCRIGFAVGNRSLIAALRKIKSYLDYGSFEPTQLAAVEALNNSDSYLIELRKNYKTRRDLFCRLLNEMGWHVNIPEASMFIWAKIPLKYGTNSKDFVDFLAQETAIILSPGAGFGNGGEGFVRISLIQNEERIAEACRRLRAIVED